MQFKHVTLDFDGSVAVLRLDHQEVMNAVSIDMLGGLAEALDAIEEKRADVRCLVITGAGRAFCTGANLQGRNQQKPGRSNAGAALETAFHPFLRRLRKLHCPIVTAVNGPAAGAGMSFALMGDMILCARSAYFLQAFRRIGCDFEDDRLGHSFDAHDFGFHFLLLELLHDAGDFIVIADDINGV